MHNHFPRFTFKSPISPDKRDPPVDLGDIGILHVAVGEVTVDSLFVKVHVERGGGEHAVGGGRHTGHSGAERAGEQQRGRLVINLKHSPYYKQTLIEHTRSKISLFKYEVQSLNTLHRY